MQRKIVVAGGCGYLGSALVGALLAEGHEVIVVDNRLTAATEIRGATYEDGDIRDVAAWSGLLRGADAVVNLAAVVGDPACALDPDLAWEINYLGTVRLAEACRNLRVPRFIFASTCSNYGHSPNRLMSVDSFLNPQSVYAFTKIHAEHHLLSVRGTGLEPVILRFATLFGLAPRMRFDLSVNVMTAHAAARGTVTVFNAEQSRPFLHVRDAARAIRAVFALEGDWPHPSVLNCGGTDLNHRMIEVGEMIAAAVPEAGLAVLPGEDPRDYQVDFSGIEAALGFAPRHSVRDGIAEIRDAFRDGLFEEFTGSRYSVLEAVKAGLESREEFDARRLYENRSWARLVPAAV